MRYLSSYSFFIFHFSIVYGALLTKTNRISRIFNASKRTAKRPNFISPKSQLCFCTMIVLIQILINVIWFLILPPEAMHHHPTREDNLLVCKVIFLGLPRYVVAFFSCVKPSEKLRCKNFHCQLRFAWPEKSTMSACMIVHGTKNLNSSAIF